MCGQAGVFSTGSLSVPELQKVRKLLIANSYRGTDSTGCMWWRKFNNTYEWNKRAVHPFIFNFNEIADVIYEDWKTGPNGNLLAVHCRAATQGKVSDDNAHPFAAGDLVGMHNGTITASFTGRDKFETDSEALYNNIATKGLKDAIGELNKGSPAYALVWMDTKAKTLNFLKNPMRPLHIYHDGSTIYWSSDAKDLRWVLDENDTTYESKTKDGVIKRKVLSLVNDRHYTINMEQVGEITYTTEEVKPAPVVYPLVGRSGGVAGDNSGFFRSFPNATTRSSSTRGANQVMQVNVDTREYRKGFDYWATLGSYHKPAQGLYHYALEFDMFYPVMQYNGIALWRVFNRKKFRQEAYTEWMGMTKERQNMVLGELMMSRSSLKQLLKGKDWSYIDKPYRKAYDNAKQYIDFYEIDKALALRIAEEESQSNVVPFEISKPTYRFGVSKKEATQEDLEELIDKGCAFCCDPCSTTEHVELFWISDLEYLCTGCQDKVMLGEYDMNLVPNFRDLPEFVAERKKLNGFNDAVIIN